MGGECVRGKWHVPVCRTVVGGRVHYGVSQEEVDVVVVVVVGRACVVLPIESL